MQQSKYLVRRFPSSIEISVQNQTVNDPSETLLDEIRALFWENWDLYFSMSSIHLLLQRYIQDEVSLDHIKTAVSTLSKHDQKRLLQLQPVLIGFDERLDFVNDDWECMILFRSITKHEFQHFLDKLDILFNVLIQP